MILYLLFVFVAFKILHFKSHKKIYIKNRSKLLIDKILR